MNTMMVSYLWTMQDFEEGKGGLPKEGQEVTFDYNGYNESGARIDSSYTKGRPAVTRIGINGLIPGRWFRGPSKLLRCSPHSKEGLENVSARALTFL